MRVDIFLPFLRRDKAGLRLRTPGRLGRWLRARLPRAWSSDWAKARPGRIRSALRRMGEGWLASPVRRLVQVAFFAAFLALFFHVCWPYGARPAEGGLPSTWPAHYADNLAAKELVEAEAFLAIDPLVGLSTAIAGRTWVWSLAWGAGILAACVLVPRGFCGYVCPLGTVIDLFDWAIGRRKVFDRFRVTRMGGWAHLKYYVLVLTLVAAAGGVLVSGYVAAIPVVTRAAQFALAPIQSGLLRGWHLVPPFTLAMAVSLSLFALVLLMGVLSPRFWCRYVCPTGALFSLGNLFRATERKVEDTCIHCNRCVEVCPFDAIKADFTTRVLDCTLCQSCGGVCPTHAIKFVDRRDASFLKVEGDRPLDEPRLSRRGFFAAGVAGVATILGVRHAFGSALDTLPPDLLPIRPPGSVPESSFLELCIRCGECYKACPNDVLQPLGLAPLGLDGLWTPAMNADWAGCESACNACGQVCPTGAIRALPLEEKRHARMGLAIVDLETCLPWAGREACQLCVDECNAAGYRAIEFERTLTEVDSEGQPIPDTGFLAPVVRADRCVGCGLCQTRCARVNQVHRGVLDVSAIVIRAGAGREDRLVDGSYRALRDAEAADRRARALEDERAAEKEVGDFYW